MQHTYALLLGSDCATDLSDLAECSGSHTCTLILSLQTQVVIVQTSVNVLLHPPTLHSLSASWHYVVVHCQVVLGMSEGSCHACLAVCNPCS